MPPPCLKQKGVSCWAELSQPPVCVQRLLRSAPGSARFGDGGDEALEEVMPNVALRLQIVFVQLPLICWAAASSSASWSFSFV